MVRHLSHAAIKSVSVREPVINLLELFAQWLAGRPAQASLSAGATVSEGQMNLLEIENQT